VGPSFLQVRGYRGGWFEAGVRREGNIRVWTEWIMLVGDDVRGGGGKGGKEGENGGVSGGTRKARTWGASTRREGKERGVRGSDGAMGVNEAGKVVRKMKVGERAGRDIAYGRTVGSVGGKG